MSQARHGRLGLTIENGRARALDEFDLRNQAVGSDLDAHFTGSLFSTNLCGTGIGLMGCNKARNRRRPTIGAGVGGSRKGECENRSQKKKAGHFSLSYF